MQDAEADRQQRRLDVVSAVLNFMNGFADDMAFAKPATWLCPSLEDAIFLVYDFMLRWILRFSACQP